MTGINSRSLFNYNLQEGLPIKRALFSAHVARCVSALGFPFSFHCNKDWCKHHKFKANDMRTDKWKARIGKVNTFGKDTQ